MKRSIVRGLLLSLLLIGCGSSQKVSELEITNVWARPTPKDSSVAVVYMRVASPVEDELIAVSASVSRSASFRISGGLDSDGGEEHDHHGDASSETTMTDSTMVLGSNSTFELAPGGPHVMLEGLERPLLEGDSFELLLTFREAGERTIVVNVSTNEPVDR